MATQTRYWDGMPQVHAVQWNTRPYNARFITVKVGEQFESRWLLPDEVAGYVQGRAYIEQRLDRTTWHPEGDTVC